VSESALPFYRMGSRGLCNIRGIPKGGMTRAGISNAGFPNRRPWSFMVVGQPESDRHRRVQADP
jgi:hypothetical protein